MSVNLHEISILINQDDPWGAWEEERGRENGNVIRRAERAFSEWHSELFLMMDREPIQLLLFTSVAKPFLPAEETRKLFVMSKVRFAAWV